jgi:hypothetical protein
MQTRRGLLRAGPRAGRAIATSGTSAVGNANAIDPVYIDADRDDSMTNDGLGIEGAAVWRKGH